MATPRPNTERADRSGALRWVLGGALIVAAARWLSSGKGRKGEREKESVPRRSAPPLPLSPSPPRSLSQTGHQPISDVRIGVVVGSIVGLLVMLGVFLGGAYGLSRLLTKSSPAAVAEEAVPEPRVQVDLAVQLAALHAREDALLNGYGRNADGTVRIPIARAMALLAARADTAAAGPEAVQVVPSESGYTVERLGPPPPTSPAYLGTSPEPDAASPALTRALERTGAAAIQQRR